jgi:peptidoglycan/xylan/chitin deacetylase (PgdA/CDA1 family)
LILVYHSIGAGLPESIAADMFRTQMDLLGNSFRVLPLEDLISRLQNGETGLAAITFDDGYRDCYEQAFPILQEKGFPFTVLPVTRFMETGERTWAPGGPPMAPLAWSQIREMMRHGAAVGCHTHEHGRWSDQSSGKIRNELITSRRILEDRTGNEVTSFAYPFGQPHDIDNRGADLLPDCGFRLGLTTLHTTVTSVRNLYQIPRLSVNPEDTTRDFLQNIRGKRDILAATERVKSIWLRARAGKVA